VIGLDTNVLLRFYLKDDAVQSPKAQLIVNSLRAGEPGWVALATILELVWVMKRKTGAGRDEIASLLELLLADDVIVIEQSGAVARAAQRFRSTKADFADCLIAESARAAGCTRTLTFDEIAARDLGMELIT
jgi:predicted nucleic-acid-binding protein